MSNKDNVDMLFLALSFLSFVYRSFLGLDNLFCFLIIIFLTFWFIFWSQERIIISISCLLPAVCRRRRGSFPRRLIYFNPSTACLICNCSTLNQHT
jgi:hypothetical protein